ncbi:MAG: hypothetical protein COV44_09290 [Deltaproteobacteria bacterium CG11_big_fil_rev_8_21_14_0_20_45_16]|nr:MAG: hypothetical protein COV44_09290 [Deltaproteobacteria bacterium CG11_big_fil_rev_8_21_14_0_20_45_16]
MRYLMAISVFCFFVTTLLAQSTRENRDHDVEWVRPEAYAIKRFQEVLGNYEESQPASLQERLIRERALLAITEDRMKNVEIGLNQTQNSEILQTQKKSLLARRDHHLKQIKNFEQKILERSK